MKVRPAGFATTCLDGKTCAYIYIYIYLFDIDTHIDIILILYIYIHICIHTSTINKHDINRNVPVIDIWMFLET